MKKLLSFILKLLILTLSIIIMKSEFVKLLPEEYKYLIFWIIGYSNCLLFFIISNINNKRKENY